MMTEAGMKQAKQHWKVRESTEGTESPLALQREQCPADY